MTRIHPAFSMLAVFLLAGCGGGGGSMDTPAAGGSTTPVTTTSGVAVNFQTANTSVAYSAASASATSTSTGGVTGSRIDAAGSGGTITVTTDTSGNIKSVVFNILTPGSNYTTNYTGPFVTLSSFNLATLASGLQAVNNGAAGTNAVVATQLAGSSQLSYSAYGMWAVNDSVTAGRIGVYAVGNMTPTTAVPASGTATYNGTTMGVGEGSTGAFALSGSAQMVANFAAKTVTTNLTNLATQNIATNIAGTIPNLTGTSTISGNAYTGALAGTGLSGTLNGNFYGPAAQETDGVWKVTGGGFTWIGSYGAK